MKLKTLKNFLFVFFIAFSTYSNAQKNEFYNSDFNEVPQSTIQLGLTPQIKASKYKVFEANIETIKSKLLGIGHISNSNIGRKKKISLPHPDGSFHVYEALENNTMSSEYRMKFPNIKSYNANDKDGGIVKFDITPQGFHAMIMIPGKSTIFIDPLFKGNTSTYIVYHKKDFNTDKIRECFFDSDKHSLEKNLQEKQVL